MRTVRCSGHPPGGGRRGLPRGCIPACTEVYPLPVDRILDTRLWKYYLASTLLRTVTRQHSSRMRIARLPTVCAVVVTIRPLSVSSGGWVGGYPRPNVPGGIYIPTPSPLVYPPSGIPNIPLVYPPLGYTPRTYPPHLSGGTWDQAYPPTFCGQTDRHLWKHYLPTTTVAGGKSEQSFLGKGSYFTFPSGNSYGLLLNSSMFIFSIIGLKLRACIYHIDDIVWCFMSIYMQGISKSFLGKIHFSCKDWVDTVSGNTNPEIVRHILKIQPISFFCLNSFHDPAKVISKSEISGLFFTESITFEWSIRRFPFSVKQRDRHK